MAERTTLRNVALELALAQHGVVSRRQLLESGIPARMITRAIHDGRLFKVFAGVYLFGRPQLSNDALLTAALLAAGDGSVLGARTAGAYWGFMKHAYPVEVIRQGRGSGRRASIRVEGEKGWPYLLVHQTTDLPPHDVRIHRGLSVTSPGRALLDCAGQLSERRFRWAFTEADRLELLDDRDLQFCALRSQGRKGGRAFRKMVERRIPDVSQTESLLEAIVLDLVRDGLIPRPEVNRKTNRYRPDFRWRESHLLVEADGYEFHRGREAFEDDAMRSNRLRSEGWTVLRFTWRMVTENHDEVALMIRRTIEGSEK